MNLVPAQCAASPTRAGSITLPAPAVVLVIVVVLLTTAMVMFQMPLEMVVATVFVGSTLAVELLRRVVAALAPSRTL